MTEDEFWQLIETKIDRSEVTELDIGALEEELGNSSPERIAAFGEHFENVHQLSYQNRIWGAAYLINGGCSDDGFDYFRGWLIGMGRAAFTNAMADPDTLADIADEDVECEDLLYIADTAYEAATGNERPMTDSPGEPEQDDDWDFEDDAEMSARYPKLYARFSP